MYGAKLGFRNGSLSGYLYERSNPLMYDIRHATTEDVSFMKRDMLYSVQSEVSEGSYPVIISLVRGLMLSIK